MNLLLNKLKVIDIFFFDFFNKIIINSVNYGIY